MTDHEHEQKRTGNNPVIYRRRSDADYSAENKAQAAPYTRNDHNGIRIVSIIFYTDFWDDRALDNFRILKMPRK